MLTTDPFNTRIEAFLARISEDRPAKIPELPPDDLNLFKALVEAYNGYDLDLTTNTVSKRKPVLDFKNDLFLWAEHNTGEYEIKQQRGYKELWRGDICVAIK